MVSIFCPTSFDHTLPQVLDISNYMPSQVNQMYYQAIHRWQYLIWVKHATLQKAKPLKAASLSQLDNTVNKSSVFNIKYAGFSTEWSMFLHFHNLTCAYNDSYNLHQKSFSLLQSIFTSLFYPTLFTRSSLQFSLTLSFSLPN